MNIILFSTTRKRAISINLSTPRVWIPLAFVIISLTGGALTAGYRLGQPGQADETFDLAKAWRQEVSSQRQQLAAVRENVEYDVDALALRMGQLQAKVIRLEALGQRMVKMADLDEGEFHFGDLPAQGGPVALADQASVEIPDLEASLERLAMQLDDREQQLNALQSLLMNSSLNEQVRPAGRPVTKGWQSSFYGWRTDPFSGKRDFHSGTDFAGKRGSDVVAVASGIVTHSGKRSGYGNIVEIAHGEGYVTRYAHNQRNLVKAGEAVEQGQLIARMGSSGRSTGPHVHFEVQHHGKSVNPAKFVKAAR